jgi:hypothetical protein
MRNRLSTANSAVPLLFLLSGTAALIDESLWMRRLGLIFSREAVLAAALMASLGLAGCAGRPGPGPGAEVRVTGGLSLEFPDGFLGQPARTIRSNILLHARDLATGKRYLGAVRNGRFCLPAAGELRLTRYEYSQAGPEFSCYLNDEIGIDIRIEPGQPRDLGTITIRYTLPRLSNRVTFARSTTRENDEPAAGRTGFLLARLRPEYWQYERILLR